MDFYNINLRPTIDSKDIEILQLKTKIRSLEAELAQRDLMIRMLEREIKHKNEPNLTSNEVSRKDLVIKILEKEIKAKDAFISEKEDVILEQEEEIEDQKEIYDDICDKMGYEWSWEWETGDDQWQIYPHHVSKTIEMLHINETYEYKSKYNGEYYVIKKLNADRAIQENESSLQKHYVRRTEKFAVLEEQDAKYQQTQKLVSDQKKEIQHLGNKIDDINKKVGYTVIWEWQENKTKWIAYQKGTRDIIEDMEIKDDYEYTATDNQQTYVITKLDTDKAIQQNKRTQYKRDIRRTERFAALEPGLMGSQVEYPKYWDMSSQIIGQYAKPKLNDLKSNQALWNEVSAHFHKTVSKSQYEVVKIEGVQNQMLYDKYCRERETMMKLIGANQLNEQYLFHGTKKANAMEYIQTEGFRKEFNSSHMYGMGTYFARDAQYSVGYSSNSNGIFKMFRCKVISGETYGGSSSYSLKSWPKKANGLIYDSLVDSTRNPSIYVVHENVRAYPMYVIHFKKKSGFGYW